nr:chromosome partitioning protein ParB [candidate division Zixibacteria bacterium]NIX79210.1 chromosome partitioning protein ParB [candidate division Zixibacteria bacterium]
LGTRVNLKRGLKKGKIEIEFYSDSDLTRILELILEG